jgi:hypothetical protein
MRITRSTREYQTPAASFKGIGGLHGKTDLKRRNGRSPVQHHSLPRRDRSRAGVIADLHGVFSRGQGDGLVDLFGRKLRAGSVEHSVVIRASSLHGQGSCLIIATATSLNLNRHGDVVELGSVGPGHQRKRVPQMSGSQLRTHGIDDGIVLIG